MNGALLLVEDLDEMIEEYDIVEDNDDEDDNLDDITDDDTVSSVHRAYKQYCDKDNYEGPITCMQCGRDEKESCYRGHSLDVSQKSFNNFMPKNNCPLFPLKERWTQPEQCKTCLSDSVDNCGVLTNPALGNVEIQKIRQSKWLCGMIPVHEYYPIVNHDNKKKILSLRKKNKPFYWRYKGNIIFVNHWGHTTLGFFNHVLTNLNTNNNIVNVEPIGVGVGRPSKQVEKQRALNELIQSGSVIMNEDDNTIDSGIVIKGAKKRGRPKKIKPIGVPVSPPNKQKSGTKKRGRPKGSKNKAK